MGGGLSATSLYAYKIEVIMKKLLILLLMVLCLFSIDGFSQRKSSGFKSSYKLKSSFNYKSPKIKSPTSYKTPKIKTYDSYKSPTYKIGGTKYNYGETYKSSGLPKVERSNTSKKEFLKSKGYSKTPKGYEVDHIIPLSKGGQDVPSNMQLLPKEIHKQKTANERKK